VLATPIPLKQAEVILYERFLDPISADHYCQRLIEETQWHQPEILMFGRRKKSPRLAAWYGDENAFYTYSGVTNSPLLWTPALSELKNLLQQVVQHEFNSVLINLYRDGNDAMGWHSDDEPELGDQPVIASVSLGASRSFLFRHKNAEKGAPSTKLQLHHGSLLTMSGNTQQYWQHSVSRTKKPITQRVNLTFRRVLS